MSLFDTPDNGMVITSSYVLEERMPILEVIHEEDEEGKLWQFHCGNGDFSSRHLRLVQLETIMCRDPSLLELTELEIGMRARRNEAGGERILLQKRTRFVQTLKMSEEPYIPTPEDFKRAERLMAERHAGLDEASQATRDHLHSQYPIVHVQLFPDRKADFRAYVFFETDAQLTASESNGSRSVIEGTVYTQIDNVGRGNRPGISVVFEYDSEENVKENFKGSYYLRMR